MDGIRWWIGGLVVLLTVISPCCAPQEAEHGNTTVGAPIVVDLSGTDPSVAALITTLLAEAQSDPTDADKRASLGMAYEVSGLPRAALGTYEQVVQLDSNQAVWWYYLAQARSKDANHEGALRAMQRSMALDESYGPAYLHRGNWFLDNGLIEEAAADFERATELEPGFPAGWIGKARVFMLQEKYDQAVQVLEQLVGTYSHPHIYQMLGTAYRKQGNIERARLALARVVPGPEPGWPDPWNNKKAAYTAGFGAGMMRAQALWDQGKLPAALDILEGLREQRPDDLALLNNLSVLYRQVGKPEASLEILEAGVKIHPNYFPFYLNLAGAYYRKGDMEHSLELLDRAIELNPSLGWAYQQKGNILMETGRHQAALDTFNHALRLDASQPRVSYLAGMLEGKLKNWEQAVDRLEQSLRLDPGQVRAVVALGGARAELGQFDEAEALFKRAEAMAPDDAQLAENRTRLAQLRAQTR